MDIQRCTAACTLDGDVAPVGGGSSAIGVGASARSPAARRDRSVPGEPRHVRFEQQVLPHLDAAYRLALGLCRSPTDAEDVVQEAMLRAFRGLDGLRVENAKPWLLTIVRHCFFNLHEQRRRRASISLPEEFGEQADLGEATERSPEDVTLDDERLAALGAALAKLSREHREILILRELEELEYHEIASVLGVPIGTVMSRLARARGAFRREWLVEHGGVAR
jgi:RNA polymerase sigma-70 factor (ECF subfamily)